MPFFSLVHILKHQIVLLSDNIVLLSKTYNTDVDRKKKKRRFPRIILYKSGKGWVCSQIDIIFTNKNVPLEAVNVLGTISFHGGCNSNSNTTFLVSGGGFRNHIPLLHTYMLASFSYLPSPFGVGIMNTEIEPESRFRNESPLRVIWLTITVHL